ncbi:hypothetical protein ABZ957_18130 [Streptomyces sp. NPDC046316]|uniref:hypothetical protein n=1 Tax=unclassified Streptomyces TaxID=2593676 RepID=UPI0033ED3E18
MSTRPSPTATLLEASCATRLHRDAAGPRTTTMPAPPRLTGGDGGTARAAAPEENEGAGA